MKTRIKGSFLLHLVLVVLALWLVPHQNVYAGSTTYYSKLTVSAQTGAGKVYILETPDATTGPVTQTFSTGTQNEVKDYYILAVPEVGWKFIKWKTNFADFTDEYANPTVCEMLPQSTDQENPTLYTAEALFEEIQSNLTISAGEHGSVDQTEAVVGVMNGVNVTVTPDEGYSVESWELIHAVVKENEDGTYLITSDGSGADASAKVLFSTSSYKVRFHGNGSTEGSMEDMDFLYVDEKPLTANAYKRAYTLTFEVDGGEALDPYTYNYTYLGWATEAEGEKVYDDEQVVKALTEEDEAIVNLYAVWQEEPYQLPLPTKEGQTFRGWKDSAGNLVGMNGEDYLPTADITLTATWRDADKTDDAITWVTPIPDMKVGESLDIAGYVTVQSGKTITYTSDNPEVISIEGTLLTANGAGTVTITAATEVGDGYFAISATQTVTVSKRKVKIVWDQTLGVMTDRQAEPVILTAKVIDENGEETPFLPQYSTSDPNIATVGADGVVIPGQSGGTIDITATYEDDDFVAEESVTKSITIIAYKVLPWTGETAKASQFYLRNKTLGTFIQTNSTALTANSANAGLFTLAGNGTYTIKNSDNRYITITSSRSIFGTTYSLQVNANSGNAMTFAAIGDAYLISNTRYLYANGTTLAINSNSNTDAQWQLISPAQMTYRSNAEKAVENYLYDETKYWNVVPDAMLNAMAEALKAKEGFEAANTTLVAMMKACDDYLAALETIDNFEATYAEHTPDTETPVADIADARAALSTATNSEDVVTALALIRQYVTVEVEKQVEKLPMSGSGKIIGKVLCGEEEVEVPVFYATNDATVLTVDASGVVSPVAEAPAGATATITLSTETTANYYAAMPLVSEEIVLIDLPVLSNYTVGTYKTGTYEEVLLDRTLKAGYNSIALPLDVEDLSVLNADWAAQLSLVTYNAQDGYSLYFKKVETMTANEPYILHVTEDIEMPIFHDVTLLAAESKTVSATTGSDLTEGSYRDWEMVSNYTPEFDMQGHYGVVNSQSAILRGGAGSTLSAFTAYFKFVRPIPEPEPEPTPEPEPETESPRRVILHYLDAEEMDAFLTGLDEILTNTDDTTVIYDLSGRRMSTPRQGVIIKDGRKTWNR